MENNLNEEPKDFEDKSAEAPDENSTSTDTVEDKEPEPLSVEVLSAEFYNELATARTDIEKLRAENQKLLKQIDSIFKGKTHESAVSGNEKKAPVKDIGALEDGTNNFNPSSNVYKQPTGLQDIASAILGK